jgi:hypothetical protein
MIELEIQWPGLALLATVLASVHLWFPAFDKGFAAREKVWMGFIGGVATGYVILYMLPKLARITSRLVGLDDDAQLAMGDLQMYYLVLVGISVYLVMNHLDTGENRWRPLAQAFDYAVHGSYSLLIGYVLVELSSVYMDLNLLITLILAMHLLGMNHILRSIRTTGFDGIARWFYFAFVLLGAALGLTTELPKPIINGMTAFLAGIILVNVISEELPLRHRDRVPWYLVGVTFYLAATTLIIILDPRPAY